MNRRKFISTSVKLVAGAAIGSMIPGCDDPRALYNCIKKDQETGMLTGNYCLPLTNGKTWSNHQSTGISGMSPRVIKDGKIYKMWYTDNTVPVLNIYYRTSYDGLNWSSPTIAITNSVTSVAEDDNQLYNPSVIKLNGRYLMWYQGQDAGTQQNLIYCQSTDGINWTSYQAPIGTISIPSITYTGESAPVVIYVNGKYLAWFIAESYLASNIIYMDSPDGVNWSNFQISIPIGFQGIYDNTSVLGCAVILDGDIYKMWYNGFDGFRWRILYAESKNGKNWYNPQLSIDSATDITRLSLINEKGIAKGWYYDTGSATIFYAESR